MKPLATLLLAILLLGAIDVAQAATGSATYQYDSLGRLIQVTYDTGTTIVFNYDAVGNRTSRVITVVP